MRLTTSFLRTCSNLQPLYTCFNNAAVHHSERLIRVPFQFDRSKPMVPFRSPNFGFRVFFSSLQIESVFCHFYFKSTPKETKSNIKRAVASSMHRIAFNISPVKVTVCIKFKENHQRSFLHSLTNPYQGLNVYVHYNPHRQIHGIIIINS